MDAPHTLEPDERGSRAAALDRMIDAGDSEPVSSIDSLSQALNVGFRVMKLLMIGLGIVFLFSNLYWVPEGSVAVQSRFGDIVGNGGGAVRQPGGPYLAFPYPMDTVVRIPTTIQKVTLSKAFWSEAETIDPTVDDRPETQSLRPGIHGSLVTADKNLVQGIWAIHYKLGTDSVDAVRGSSVMDYIRNVGSQQRAEALILRLAEGAVVRVVARTDVARIVAGRIGNREIKRLIIADLKRLRAGITITNVSTSQYAVPKVLEVDFEAVNQAESQKALAIEKASRHRVSTLNELAGGGWRELLDAIHAYETAMRREDIDEERRAFEAAKDLFDSAQAGGAVKQLLDEARSEKTATIQRARASAARFNQLLPAYEANSRMVKRQLIEDTINRVWSDIGVEALYVPKGQRLFLDLGRKNDSRIGVE